MEQRPPVTEGINIRSAPFWVAVLTIFFFVVSAWNLGDVRTPTSDFYPAGNQDEVMLDLGETVRVDRVFLLLQDASIAIDGVWHSMDWLFQRGSDGGLKTAANVPLTIYNPILENLHSFLRRCTIKPKALMPVRRRKIDEGSGIGFIFDSIQFEKSLTRVSPATSPNVPFKMVSMSFPSTPLTIGNLVPKE